MRITIIIFLVALSLAILFQPQIASAEDASGDKPKTYTIRGEVLWNGPSPVVHPIPTTAYRSACGKRHAVDILNLRKVRMWHKRLMNVAVWLEPVLGEMTPEEIQNLKLQEIARHSRPPLKIIQKNCQFVPRIVVVPVGTEIEIYNKDKKDHWFSVEVDGKQKAQYVQYYGVSPSVFTFDTPDIYHVTMGKPVVFMADRIGKIALISAFHRWMTAWIVVTNKFWFDESVDSRGIFEIAGVPKGVYRVYSWHPYLGEMVSVVNVPDDTKGLVAINYFEEPGKIVEIPSTITTTAGEVKDAKIIWDDLDNW